MVEGQRGERGESIRALHDDPGQTVVDEHREVGASTRLFDQRPRCGERQHLLVDTGLVQNALPVLDIPVSRHDEIPVARGVEHRIAVLVLGDPILARPLPDRRNVLRRIEVVVKVDDHGSRPRVARRVHNRYTGTPAATRESPTTASPVFVAS